MKHIVLKAFALLCTLLLVCTGLTACGNTTDPETPADGTVTTVPGDTNATATRPTLQPVEATGSIFLGEWNVKSEKTAILKLTFEENGTVIITTENGALGGTFVQTGDDQLSISTSSSVMEGTFTVDGDTIVFTTANDTLTLTKAK